MAVKISSVVWENVEAHGFKSSLTNTDYVLRGGRSHLFLLTAGAGALHIEQTINFAEAPILIWVPQGTSSKFSLEAGARGAAVSIPELQLGISLPTGTLGADVRQALLSPLVKRFPDNVVEKRLVALTETITDELFTNAPAAQNVVHYNLTLLLIEIWRITAPDTTQSKSLPRSIFQNFVSLVELHVTDHWTVANYADHIGVSKDRLTSAVRRATGRSPLAEIHRKLMQEAEQQLLTSSRQVSEIAYRLGFKDTAYFNRFFQRNAKMPPGKYRAEKQHQSPASEFSAWP
ncbi:AraC family transcriptional regulator [Sneathiella marina]|uniref:AraC family transcriptional regulator n=1 Tax=Sneathiella marina TaxID=2950108 RepID=A0ABY4WBH2_9PROT|nr:helix-turn-helix domain-containing protein [Sneathiella marina]USG62006.1 AraC family transcriptional regulator [Sneathiella marina]